MNKRELEQRLINENIPKDSYYLKGGYPNEAYCLAETYGKWEIYYSEKGRKSGVKFFMIEEEACDYFYNELIRTLKNKEVL